jgi:Ion channel
MAKLREIILARGDKLNDQLLIVMAALLLILLFVIAPLEANGVISGSSFGYIFAVTLIPAAFLVSGDRMAVGAIGTAIVLIIAASGLEFRQFPSVDDYLDAAAWLIAGITLSSVVARAVFASGRVTYHRIVGGILLFLSVGLIFVALFSFVLLRVPNAFANIGSGQDHFPLGNLIYFSFVTLTTMGYGDIVPLHPYARGLVNIEAIIGQLYPATLLARLVTLELTSRTK